MEFERCNMDKKPRIPKSTAMQRAAHNLANELQDTDSRPHQKAARPMALGRKNKINNENIKQRSKMPLRKRGNGSSGGGSKPPKKKMSITKRIIIYILLIGITVGIGITSYAAYVIYSAPKIEPKRIYDSLSERSTLYDEKGKQIEHIFSETSNRKNVSYKKFPKNLTNAVIAIEDKTFRTHHGFNFIRMAGAVFERLTGKQRIGGTSTITQQLARNAYLSTTKSERSLKRKLIEAYYAIEIENNLTKDQIIEAYLNSIFYGQGAFGIAEASHTYFSKDVSKLNLSECAAIAALPQAPDHFAFFKTIPEGSRVSAKNIIRYKGNQYLYNGEVSKPRRNQVLQNMADQGLITNAQKNAALKVDLKKRLKPNPSKGNPKYAYFSDFVVEQIIRDLMKKYHLDYASARTSIYTKGFKIRTSLNRNMQSAIDTKFKDSGNFPNLTNIKKDRDGNILDKNGNVVLQPYSDFFGDNDAFTLRKSEYKKTSQGIKLLAGNRLKFIKTKVQDGRKEITDYSIEFKNIYKSDGYRIRIYQGGALLIPAKYKSIDSQGNVTVSKAFFSEKSTKSIVKKRGNEYVFSKSGYILKQGVVQPQAAMVVSDIKTGAIKAMSGGRNTEGRNLYNRALMPRQPGSCIKPIGVYGPALQQAYEYQKKGSSQSPITYPGLDGSTKTENYGRYWTATSPIVDSPIYYNGKKWPKNWYNGYKGTTSLRRAVQQSVNTCAVKVFQSLGPTYVTEKLRALGVSTIRDDGSSANDLNPSALALGGMTSGISPLEMTAAYASFPNKGKYVSPKGYLSVTDRNGVTLLKNESKKTKVFDDGVAFIMTDILRSVVTQGLGTPASVQGQLIAGKTGTTSDTYDIWFCGFTPKYAAALWIGNDVNIELTEGSDSASRLWGKIMAAVLAGRSPGSFPGMPSNVIRAGDYYIQGTQGGRRAYPSSGQNNYTRPRNNTKPAGGNNNPPPKPPKPPKPAEPENPPDTPEP